MTFRKAVSKANELCHKTGLEYFIVYAPSVWSNDGSFYHVCDNNELDTSFAGLKPEYSTF